jgi:uncharacterized membrane protein
VAIAGLLLVFLLVSLEVRQYFHGNYLDLATHGRPRTGEMAAYSLAWAGLAGAVLVAGILRQNVLLRWASLLLLILTIFKVFLLDLAHLQGLMRVLSLAGLGLSLMAVGFLYFHFVFKKPPTSDVTPAPAL